jgi:hypothetical protein
LYTTVTRKQKETNGQINKTFARAMISLLKGDHLDWAKYAIYCDKYSMEIREIDAPLSSLMNSLQVQR